jgi:hypothetical protein
MKPVTELDLSCEDEDPDFGVAGGGVYCESLAELAEKITEVKDTVKKINLENQPALNDSGSPLPEVLRECINLEELNLSCTGITEIPGFVFDLPRLRSLSFNGCYELERLPAAELLRASNLRELRFGVPAGRQVPEEICGLANLEELSLSVSRPAGGVFVLPKSIAALRRLRTFKFQGDGDGWTGSRFRFDLEKSAEILAACPALEHFDIWGVNTGAGHRALALLTSLKTLSLRHMSVEGNPFESIANLGRLEKIEVIGVEFGIDKLPDIFAALPELRELNVVGNFFREIPPSVYGLKNLKQLEFVGCGVKTIDRNIGRLENLMYLLLYDNRIETLPESIYTLKKLKRLDIAENNFSSGTITEIKKKFKAAGKIPVKKMPFDPDNVEAFDAYNGEKIRFLADCQGGGQKTKLLRATPFDPAKANFRRSNESYIKLCEAAVDENPWALQLVDTRIDDYGYFRLCERAIKQNGNAIIAADAEKLKWRYFSLVRAAVINAGDFGNNIKKIKDALLTDEQYIEVCVLAALQNNFWEFLKKINVKRLSREAYFRICWVAIIHNPLCAGGVDFDRIDEKETEELRALALRLGCRPELIPEQKN